MATSIKKRAVPKKSESENEGSFNMDEEIQADFEGRNLEGADFNGIQQLLKQVFLKEHVDVSQLTDMLIAQEGIGSVLKQSWTDEDDADDDDDMLTDSLDVFGVTSVLNLSMHEETPVVQQLLNLVKKLMNQHASEETKIKFENILTDSNRIGLLINERFINLPPKIADPLLTSLEAELARIVKKHESYNFDYLVMICKIYKSKGDKSNTIYSNAEEEIFNNEAEVSLEYNVTSQCDTGLVGQWKESDDEMIPYRKILFVKGSKFPNIIEKVKTFVS